LSPRRPADACCGLQDRATRSRSTRLITVIPQVDYIVNNGFIPSLEFAQPYEAYVSSESCIRFGGTGVTSNYADNRCDPRQNADLHSWLIWPARDFQVLSSTHCIRCTNLLAIITVGHNGSRFVADALPRWLRQTPRMLR